MTCVESSSCPSRPSRTRSSMAERNAARVFPDPVGAAMRVCRCFLISGHARNCGSVASGKLRANQRATAGWKISRFIRDEDYTPSSSILHSWATRPPMKRNHRLLKLFPELLELFFQFLDFSGQRFDLFFETRATCRSRRSLIDGLQVDLT